MGDMIMIGDGDQICEMLTFHWFDFVLYSQQIVFTLFDTVGHRVKCPQVVNIQHGHAWLELETLKDALKPGFPLKL